MSNTPDTTDLETWLVQWVAAELGVPTSEIGLDEDFDDMGLSSIQAVSLAGELEEKLSRKIDPNIAWECPTLETLIKHLNSTTQIAAPVAGKFL